MAPSTPFIGVRISWLMVARNWLFAASAARASSTARSSDRRVCSAAWRSRSEARLTSRNSRVARSIVRPVSTASTAIGSDCTEGMSSDTSASVSTWNPSRIWKARPAMAMNSAATATEPVIAMT